MNDYDGDQGMTRDEFLRLFEEIIEAEPGTLSGDEKLMDLEGWDSLAVVSFIAMVDENFDTQLSPRSISKAESVSVLISLLGDKITD